MHPHTLSIECSRKHCVGYGSIAGMQAAGSEAERRQARLTAARVRVALLT